MLQRESKIKPWPGGRVAATVDQGVQCSGGDDHPKCIEPRGRGFKRLFQCFGLAVEKGDLLVAYVGVVGA